MRSVSLTYMGQTDDAWQMSEHHDAYLLFEPTPFLLRELVISKGDDRPEYLEVKFRQRVLFAGRVKVSLVGADYHNADSIDNGDCFNTLFVKFERLPFAE